MMNHVIGLHLRSNQSLHDLIEKALRLNLPFFQCFLRQQSGNMIVVNKEELASFRTACQHYPHLFVHGSYRINLADPTVNNHPALKQEIYWAEKLGFTHMIIHPGATSDYRAGIDAIARALNSIIRSSTTLQFVVENVAFASPSIGGDIADLQNIKNKLDNPERLGFCVDTAHAYAFGYNLADERARKEYIQAIGQVLGFDRITLIHINDTQSMVGSRHDIHCRMGSGTIGVEALKQFVLDPRMAHIPLLLELPAISEQEEEQDLITVQSWYHTKQE